MRGRYGVVALTSMLLACGDAKQPSVAAPSAATAAASTSGATDAAAEPPAPPKAPPKVLFARASDLPERAVGVRRERVSGLDRVGPWTRAATFAYYGCGGLPFTRLPTITVSHADAASEAALVAVASSLSDPAQARSFLACGKALEAKSERRFHTVTLGGTDSFLLSEVRLFDVQGELAPAHFVKSPDEPGLTELRCLPSKAGTCSAHAFAMARISRYGRLGSGPLALLRELANGPRMDEARAGRFEQFSHLDGFDGDVWLGEGDGALVGLFDLGGLGRSRTETMDALTRLKVIGAAALGDDLRGPARIEWVPQRAADSPRLVELLEAMRTEQPVPAPAAPASAFEFAHMRSVERATVQGLREAEVRAEGGRVSLAFRVDVPSAEMADYHAARAVRFRALEGVLTELVAGSVPPRQALAEGFGEPVARAFDSLATPASKGQVSAVAEVGGLALPVGTLEERYPAVRIRYRRTDAGIYREILLALKDAGYQAHLRHVSPIGAWLVASREDDALEIGVLVLGDGTVLTVRPLVRRAP